METCEGHYNLLMHKFIKLLGTCLSADFQVVGAHLLLSCVLNIYNIGNVLNILASIG